MSNGQEYKAIIQRWNLPKRFRLNSMEECPEWTFSVLQSHRPQIECPWKINELLKSCGVERVGNTHSPTNNTKPANVHLYVSERRRHCCLAVWFCLSSLGFLTRNVINLQLKATKWHYLSLLLAPVYWLELLPCYILHYMTSRIERWRRWRRWRHCHRFYFTFLELFSQTSDGSWIAIVCGYIRAFCLQFIPVVLYMILSFVVQFGVIGYQNIALFVMYIQYYSGDS